MILKLTVNGETREVDADAGTPLLWVLREDLGLTGTKFGCGRAACGACTVHLDGQADQCMSAAYLLGQQPNPDDHDIDVAMRGNLCRCGTYPRIRAAIHRAAEILRG